MTKRFLYVLTLMLLCAAFGLAQSLPSGAHLTVRLNQELSSATARAGQTWEGTLAKDVVVNGNTVARAGTSVRGTVAKVNPSGRLHHPGLLSLRVTRVGNQTLRSSIWSREGKSHTKSNVTKIGGGAAAGAVIGGIAGGGKGAALGTLIGGGAGTGVAAATGKQEVVLPAESTLAFTVTSAATAHRSKTR